MLISVCRKKKLRTFAAVLNNKTLLIDPWCNWQHVWFWSRRVQVRALTGQPYFESVLMMLMFR